MQNILELKRLTAVLLLICISLIDGEEKNSRLLAALVPRIDQPEFQLTPNGQQYYLYINLPDGSNRMENVELLAPGTPQEELHLTGTINENFPIGTSITIYEAGRNGYTVKYKYNGIPTLTPPIYKPFFISAGALKSAAG